MGKIISINPYNKNHIELVKKFEKEYQLDSSISNSLIAIANSQSEKDNKTAKKQSNIVEDYFILKEETVKGLCHIYGERDRKTCHITFPSLNKKSKIKQTLILVTNYVMDNLGMIEVLIEVNKESKDIITYLEKNNFENLGEESSKIVYLKEKETKKIGEGSYHESIR